MRKGPPRQMYFYNAFYSEQSTHSVRTEKGLLVIFSFDDLSSTYLFLTFLFYIIIGIVGL